jgi:putative CocE/NonD family hydrolase
MLAVDVYRPTKQGVVEANPLPLVWMSKRYLRAKVDADGKVGQNLIEGFREWDRPQARKLITHGYVLAAADMRGTGASFGTWSECSDPSSSEDGYDVTEWLAAKPFCDGNVGMFGASYEGRMQLNAASAAPPHLKAIMPEVSPFDWYTVIHEGGSYSKRFTNTGAHFRSCDLDASVAPVDEDRDGSQAAEARRQHEEGNDYAATSGELPYRDASHRGAMHWQERSGEALLPGIEASGVASYQTSGWYARVGLEQILWFSNMARSATGNRHRLLMGPWSTGGVAGATDPEKELWATETLRFMDYWLKGIDNGIMDEPAVAYATQVDAKNRVVGKWRFAKVWPPPEAQARDYQFAAGGALAAGVGTAGRDDFTVDYTVAAPIGDTNAAWIEGKPGTDYADYNAKCLTYTTAPLGADVEVTGHPIVHIHVESTAADCDVIVHLQDVDERSISTFVTRKRLRASHRATSPAPYFYFGSPWHSHAEADAQPIPAGEVVELAFSLLPTSYRFRAGHRIRVSVAGADANLFITPVLDPAPVLSVHRGDRYPSRITLPVIPATD